jgi:hypothetical protein
MAFAFAPAGADTEDTTGAALLASRVCRLSRTLVTRCREWRGWEHGCGQSRRARHAFVAARAARSRACGAPGERECAVALGNAPQFGEIVRCPYLIEQRAGDLIV